MDVAGRGRGTGRRAETRDWTRRTLVASCVVFALLVAACGSTLPEAEQVAAVQDAQGLEPSSGLPPGAHINEQGEIVNAQGEVIGSAEDFGNSSGSGAAAGATKGDTAEPISTGANGPGVTHDSIKLGLYNFVNGKVARDALGLDALGSFDYKRGWQALLKYQNAHGGIAGRRIVPVFFDFDSASSQTITQQEQQQCTAWTEDDHVFAALTAVASPTFLKCMQDAGAVVNGLAVSTASITPMHDQFPYYVEPIAMTLDRAAGAMVDGLNRLKYFESDDKLGLVTFDHPNFKYAAENGLEPALDRYRIPLSDTAYLHYPQTVDEYGQLTNDATNAVLRFKAEGIDHVVFIDQGATAAWAFALAAERQDFRPRYGLSTQAGNQVLADLLGGDAGAQLHGALSVGWEPARDTREADNPHRDNPTGVLCLSIMRRAGVDTSTPNGRIGAFQICDALWSLTAALRGAPAINQPTYHAAMNELQSAYSPASTWSTKITSRQHDGVAAMANLRFVDSCSCFKYLSKPYAIP